MKRKLFTTIFFLITFLTSCAPRTVAPVPTSTLMAIPTATTVPTITPTSAPQSLADAPDLSTWVGDYVHAYGGKVTVNGVEMDANQLTEAIRKNSNKFIQKKPVKGVDFLFLVVNNIPLAFLKNEKWETTTIKFVDDNVNIRFGSTVHEGVLFVEHNESYKHVLDDQFEIISPVDPTIVDVSDVLEDPYYGLFIKNLAQNHTVRLYNLFIPGDFITNDFKPNTGDLLWDGAPSLGEKASIAYQEKIKNSMEQKAFEILQSNPFVTEIGFASEAINARDDGFFEWVDSPYYRAFGDKWLIEAYLATYNAIIKLGKVPGKDIQLYYADYNCYLPGNKSTILHRELVRLKEEVAKVLGINPEDVPIVVEMEFHLTFKNNPNDWGSFFVEDFTYEKLKSNFDSFSDIGKVWLGEVTFLEGTQEQYANTLMTILKASIDSENVESILFWDLLEIDSDAWGKGDLLFTFNGTDRFSPTSTYYEILHLLFNWKTN